MSSVLCVYTNISCAKFDCLKFCHLGYPNVILSVQNPVGVLIQVVFFHRCVCHFGFDWFIWPVTLFKENIEIILYLQIPVDLLFQLVKNFFLTEIFNMCVSSWYCWFVDLASLFFQIEYRKNYTISAKPCVCVDSIDDFITPYWKFQCGCIILVLICWFGHWFFPEII